ncbi:MAG: cytochrome c [Lysobacterales bacterium]
MKRLSIALLVLAVMAAVALFATRPRVVDVTAVAAYEADAANGERLFHAGGCGSCHGSDAGDAGADMLGGGLAMASPYGVFHVPNISTDPHDGIGAWSLQDFVSAMKAGTSPDGRHYYPAFPYASYARMSLEDLADLKAYLDTLPPVQSEIAVHDLAFPWNVRAGIGLWKMLNLDEAPVMTDLPDEQLVLRGRYLVEGPGHCGECHTPRDRLGGLVLERWLAGAPDPEGEGRVPNITPTGLEGWSRGDIAYYLSSGFTPDFDTVGGSMARVQKNMAKLPEEDLQAIAAYLKAIPVQD